MTFRTAIFSSALLFSISIITLGQNPSKPPADWFLRDPETDFVQGISAEKAYSSLLKGLPSRTVIVAIIDSGIDIEHEDLKSVIWTNTDEIPGNGVDDDKNGYVDDVHGWNFIGGKSGNVNEDTYELTREYVRFKKKFENVDESKISKKQKKDFEQYKVLKDKFEKRKAKEAAEYDKFTKQYNLYRNIQQNFSHSVDTLKSILKVEKLTPEDVEKFQTTDPNLLFSKGLIGRMVKNMGERDIDSLRFALEESVEYFEGGVDQYKTIVEFGYNEDFDSRLIVGDDYKNSGERSYGNNDVMGPDAEHGTHVAGIIGADRKNEIGIKGIADNVLIMSIRTVPNGDERDKDVANAIRYAVDNGAQVINMSFGKSLSPEKGVVDQAVKYAEKKGVLLIHASGNDGEDIDKQRDFPNRFYLDGKEAKNWVEVGASSWEADENLVASFSNYGKKSLDLFAPGVDIYSTTPKNKYKNLDGTSMACPVTVGVAALLMSYFPDLSAVQVADILKKSTRKFDGLKVRKPGGGKASLNELSNTGGLVNAYEAIKMAFVIKAQLKSDR